MDSVWYSHHHLVPLPGTFYNPCSFSNVPVSVLLLYFFCCISKRWAGGAIDMALQSPGHALGSLGSHWTSPIPHNLSKPTESPFSCLKIGSLLWKVRHRHRNSLCKGNLSGLDGKERITRKRGTVKPENSASCDKSFNDLASLAFLCSAQILLWTRLHRKRSSRDEDVGQRANLRTSRGEQMCNRVLGNCTEACSFSERGWRAA